MTDVRLAVVGLRRVERQRARYEFRDWAMDSGAFSAKNSGETIDLAAYIETCHGLRATDPLLTEVFALDVIGDHKASLRNTEKMWEAGIPAIPTYHVGEPTEALLYLARTYPKIALGGAVMYRRRAEWAGQCFAHIHRAGLWPKLRP